MGNRAQIRAGNAARVSAATVTPVRPLITQKLPAVNG